MLNISLVIVLGLWLVTKGVRAGIHQRWHRVHVGNNKELAHVHNHNHDQLKETGSIWGNVLAGASGGLVPCIDALSILIIAASVHMILFGLVIVFFFSLGLATSIIVLGLLVIRTKKLIKIEEKIGEKISIYAPLLTGIVIIFLGIGLLLTR
jgi:ABC-type nickel/cobalt efflux system permease component RcnA